MRFSKQSTNQLKSYSSSHVDNKTPTQKGGPGNSFAFDNKTPTQKGPGSGTGTGNKNSVMNLFGSFKSSSSSSKSNSVAVNKIDFKPPSFRVTRPQTVNGVKGYSNSGNKTAPPHLDYYGGDVIEAVEVVPVYIGQVPDSQRYDEFYASLVGGPFMDWLVEYNTDTESITRGTWITSMSYPVDTPSKPILYDDEQDIKPAVYTLIQQGIITPTTNTYIPLHFGPGYSIQAGSDKSCDQFCGYHGSVDISDLGIEGVPYVRYGVLPDLGSGGCEKVCGDKTPFENTCVTASHEIIETVTNPQDGGNLSWYDKTDNAGEIGDLCSYKYGTITGYYKEKEFAVQQLWSNERNSCYAPAPDAVSQ
ncbi:hypothetical protein HDU76_006673 [Blyttiomyces sp. JEL0837]|nr:hypothetical protein HDU76_006673 [Blyttiomyces sp. JEL0837]